MQYFTKLLIKLDAHIEYPRIISNLKFSSNNIPYNNEYIDYLIDFFTSEERYEYCTELLNLKNNVERHNHENSFV